MNTQSTQWIDAISESVDSYRRMIDAAVNQLSDREFFCRPSPETNSVAVLLRHLGGNLQSRWTDYLTTDGEKPDRDRDAEFADWEGDRNSLMEYFDAGWDRLTAAIQEITGSSLNSQVNIRGEPHTMAQAMIRSLTHIGYHTGQLVMIARTVHDGPWNWLTIAPGGSQQHNRNTWGTSASRSVFGRSTGEKE